MKPSDVVTTICVEAEGLADEDCAGARPDPWAEAKSSTRMTWVTSGLLRHSRSFWSYASASTLSSRSLFIYLPSDISFDKS